MFIRKHADYPGSGRFPRILSTQLNKPQKSSLAEMMVIIDLGRKGSIYKFNNLTEWNIFSHFLHSCLNSGLAFFHFFFVLVIFFLLFDILLCSVGLIRKPLLYFMFVSTFYFACVTWLCLDVLFGKFQIYLAYWFL